MSPRTTEQTDAPAVVVQPVVTPPQLTAPQMAVQVLKDHGLGVVVSIYLIYWATSSMSGTLLAISTNLKDHMQETAYFAHQICINTAKDEVQARACEIPKVRTGD